MGKSRTGRVFVAGTRRNSCSRDLRLSGFSEGVPPKRAIPATAWICRVISQGVPQKKDYTDDRKHDANNESCQQRRPPRHIRPSGRVLSGRPACTGAGVGRKSLTLACGKYFLLRQFLLQSEHTDRHRVGGISTVSLVQSFAHQ